MPTSVEVRTLHKNGLEILTDPASLHYLNRLTLFEPPGASAIGSTRGVPVPVGRHRLPHSPRSPHPPSASGLARRAAGRRSQGPKVGPIRLARAPGGGGAVATAASLQFPADRRPLPLNPLRTRGSSAIETPGEWPSNEPAPRPIQCRTHAR